jgi:hypothetical protein
MTFSAFWIRNRARPCFLNRSKITQYLQACLLMGDPGARTDGQANSAAVLGAIEANAVSAATMSA